MDRSEFAGLCYQLIDYFSWLDYYENKDAQDGDNWARVEAKRRDVLAQMKAIIDAELEQNRTE